MKKIILLLVVLGQMLYSQAFSDLVKEEFLGRTFNDVSTVITTQTSSTLDSQERSELFPSLIVATFTADTHVEYGPVQVFYKVLYEEATTKVVAYKIYLVNTTSAYSPNDINNFMQGLANIFSYQHGEAPFLWIQAQRNQPVYYAMIAGSNGLPYIVLSVNNVLMITTIDTKKFAEMQYELVKMGL